MFTVDLFREFNWLNDLEFDNKLPVPDFMGEINNETCLLYFKDYPLSLSAAGMFVDNDHGKLEILIAPDITRITHKSCFLTLWFVLLHEMSHFYLFLLGEKAFYHPEVSLSQASISSIKQVWFMCRR